jgi:sulfotransferase famil protein
MRSPARRASFWKRELLRLRRRSVYTRSLFAAPFSALARCRLAWLAEEAEWRAANIPQVHVTKALLYVEETGAFYIPIPKAANTSILSAIARVVAPRAGENLPKLSEPFRNVLQVGCRPADFRSGARVAFTVARHPVRRFWSAYNHVIAEHPDGRVAAEVRQTLGLAPERALTPEILLDYVETQSMEDMDHHFRPQYAICGAELLPVRIARVENLAEDLGRLAEEGHFPRGSLDWVGWGNRRTSGVVHDRLRHIDPRIARVYRRDFTVLGYSA